MHIHDKSLCTQNLTNIPQFIYFLAVKIRSYLLLTSKLDRKQILSSPARIQHVRKEFSLNNSNLRTLNWTFTALLETAVSLMLVGGALGAEEESDTKNYTFNIFIFLLIIYVPEQKITKYENVCTLTKVNRWSNIIHKIH